MTSPRDLHNAGLAAFQAGRAAEGAALLAKAMARDPDNAALRNNYGVVLDALGRHAEAVDLFDRAVALKSDYPEAYFNRGNAQQAQGAFGNAEASYTKALTLRPSYAEARNGRGNARRAQADAAAALTDFDVAIALQPRNAIFHNNRGNALKDLRRFDDALQAYDRAIALAPALADAHFNRGNILQDLKRFVEALASYDQALALNPGKITAHINRGNALRHLERFTDALASAERALALDPTNLDAQHNKGGVLGDLGQHEAAVAAFDAAISHDHTYADAHNSRGVALRALSRHGEALQSHERALALRPDDAEVHWALANCLLQIGDFARGWEEYEWRWKAPSAHLDPRNFAQPRWQGEPLAGKTILLHAEQGLGDAIQFCRYAASVARLGARVILEAPAALVPLLSSLEGVAGVVARSDATPPFDLHCPLLSLPLAFKTELSSIPLSAGYLSASPAKLEAWRERLGAPARPRIGLVWSGNPSHKNDRNRSIPLATLLAHLPGGADYVSLQKDVRESDAALLAGSGVRHFGERLADFTDTAALASLMDLVVSVDTSMAHLAGALARPVWILLPTNPDWRWLLDRERTPWYDAATLYRQKTPGDWPGVLERVKVDLGKLGSV